MPLAAGISLAALLFTSSITIIAGVWRFASISATMLAAIARLTDNDALHIKNDDALRLQVSDNTVRIARLETAASFRDRATSHPDIASHR